MNALKRRDRNPVKQGPFLRPRERDAGGKEGGAAQSSIVSVIQSMLSENGRLQMHPQTNSLIVTDSPERFPQIEEIIESLDSLIPQISIEVNIVETDEGTSKKLGLEIGSPDGTLATFTGPSRLVNQISDNSRFFASPADLAGASVKDTSAFGGNPQAGIFFGMLSFQQFSVVLRALESNGEGRFLARPKILTLNNKMAEISISADTAIGQKTSMVAQTGTVSTTAEREKTGISLRVTPQVNEGDLVTLLIEPTISRPQASEFFPSLFVDPQNRSIRTSVRVKDGSTLLIGGLLSNDTSKTIRRVPFLGRIPIIGRLFTYEQKKDSRQELMIFITPRIVKL